MYLYLDLKNIHLGASTLKQNILRATRHPGLTHLKHSRTSDKWFLWNAADNFMGWRKKKKEEEQYDEKDRKH